MRLCGMVRIWRHHSTHPSSMRVAFRVWMGWSFFLGLFFFFWVFFFFFWSVFLLFMRKNPTFRTFWTDFLSFPLGFRWFFIGKTLFSLHFGRISYHFPEVFLGFSFRETLFSLHFVQISCHFLRFLGFEARLAKTSGIKLVPHTTSDWISGWPPSTYFKVVAVIEGHIVTMLKETWPAGT